MPTYTYFVYSPDALEYESSTNSWELRSDFDPSEHRYRIEITDDDSTFNGDWGNSEVGNDANQTGVVYDMAGDVVASGLIYDEMFYVLQTPAPGAMYLELIEIGGTAVGYLPSEAMTPGVPYYQTSSSDVDQAPGTTLEYSAISDVPCFGPGTLISTTDGDLPVEWLASGDRVITRDHGAQPLRWIGRFRLTAAQLAQNPSLRPVQIGTDTFGPGAPDAPLALSRQHRVFVDGPDVEYYFGTDKVFAAAKDITADPAPFDTEQEYTFHHLLFDAHHVIRANGLWTESLFAAEYPGRMARAAGIHLPHHIRHPRTAYRCLSGWEARFLMHMRRQEAAKGARHDRAA